MPVRYHATHSCGHQVWWESETLAEHGAASPCPWCGGETGVFAPYGILDTSAGKVFPQKEMVSSDLARGPHGEITIVHRADEACCKGMVMSPFTGTR